MKDKSLEAIVEPRTKKRIEFETLMPWRVRNILLVSSLYDSYTFQEDGRITESLFSEYLQLNLRYAPSIKRVSTGAQALELLASQKFELVIFMIKTDDTNINLFCRKIQEIDKEVSLVLLANNSRELASVNLDFPLVGTNRLFVWGGDVRLFLAIIKSIEDRRNAWHDAAAIGVPSIILIEDNVRFYSSYLPLLYTLLLEHSQHLLSDGLNTMKKLLRMRSRAKILLATTYEEGNELFELYKEHVMGVIVDASFPRNGKMDSNAGIRFAKMVKAQTPDRPILMQSSDVSNAHKIMELGGVFINKRSPTLLGDLHHFMEKHLGFADFVFRLPTGEEVAKATDLRSLIESIKTCPLESIVYHANRNDFSTWLMNRTEFALAKALRPTKVADFPYEEGIRDWLLSSLRQHTKKVRAGVIADFSDTTFEENTGFVRIGQGSLGGKGRGLAFIYTLLEQYRINEAYADVNIFVPPTAVIAVDVFDEFMYENDLYQLALSNATDEEIADQFHRAKLPRKIINALRTFLSRVDYPLAVRSSSLLEDGSHQPFAGVYQTCMIPNNDENLETRLKQLISAVKRVYASTYFQEAKAYIASTSSRTEEEKMAVVIQQLVGNKYEHYLYPSLAGVARSYNYYPIDQMESDDGIVSSVLGLGKTVVDGGRCVRFSPKHPHKLYQFSSPKDTLQTAQTEFAALDLNALQDNNSEFKTPGQTVVNLTLDDAQRHGSLYAVGSTYDRDNDAVYDGISRPGIRLVTLAGVLKGGAYPLADMLSYLLKIGSVAFSRPVEIEFAANFRKSPDTPHEFAFLQIRPVVVDTESTQIDLQTVNKDEILCISPKALGNGIIENITDLVYVPNKTFDRSKTMEIAHEIGILNAKLKEANRPYILIGPGRWGSADRWLGIPVTWSQISNAACIIETDMHDIKVEPSQGTHFFQNITSLGIVYFTVNFDDEDGKLDLQWADKFNAANQLEYVRHLQFKQSLVVQVNGRRKLGVIYKPGVPVFNEA